MRSQRVERVRRVERARRGLPTVGRIAAAALLLLLVVPAAPALARGPKPTEVVGLPAPFDLLSGRFPRGGGWTADAAAARPPSEPPAEAADGYARLAWRVRYGGGVEDPAAYVALADWHAQHGEADLAWYASMRALELGGASGRLPAATKAALVARCAEIEAKWRSLGRHDAPDAGQFMFLRSGADRWAKSFERNVRQAASDGENVAEEKVLRRLGEESDVEVPPVILGAESFMRRWGVALLIAGIASVFWTLYLVAVLRKRRRRGDPFPSS